MYDLFNKVLVLSQGNTIYFGDSSTAGVLRWFEGTLQRSLPLGTSIPDFVLDLVNISFLEDEDGKEGGMERGEEEGKKPKNGLASTGEQHGLSSSGTSASSASNSLPPPRLPSHPSPVPPLGLKRRASKERKTKKKRNRKG